MYMCALNTDPLTISGLSISVHLVLTQLVTLPPSEEGLSASLDGDWWRWVRWERLAGGGG